MFAHDCVLTCAAYRGCEHTMTGVSALFTVDSSAHARFKHPTYVFLWLLGADILRF